MEEEGGGLGKTSVQGSTSDIFCFSVRPDGDLHFDCVNLNSLSNWFVDKPEGKLRSFLRKCNQLCKLKKKILGKTSDDSVVWRSDWRL